jgi:site-specific recombinase XerD
VKDRTILGYEVYLAGRSISEATRQNYMKFIKTFLGHTQKQACDVTQLDIDEYVRYCIKHRSHNGNGTRFRCIKYFFNWYGKDFELPMLSMRETDKAVLTDKQLEILFDTVEQMDARHQLVFYLEYDGIRRPLEICNLLLNARTDDILYYNGKTHKDHIILTDRLMKAWDDYVEYERPLPKTFNDQKYLLLNKSRNGWYGTHLNTIHSLGRIIQEIACRANITIPMGENPTNYLVKRTSITRHLKVCPDPKIIQLQAGHSKLATTMRYNRISDDDRRQFFSKRKGYKKNPHVKIPEEQVDYVLKTSSDLPQDLNKIKGGELAEGNASFSFSVSFDSIVFGTEKADGNNHIAIVVGSPPSINLEPIFSHFPSASDIPICGGVR